MKNASDTWSLNWRRYSANAVDVLIGATTFVVAYATIDGAADFLELLIGVVIALVGIGLLLEPTAVAQSARDVDAQPSTRTNADSGRWGDDFDTRIGEAMSP
jgi:hypothetical protein